MSNTLPLSAKPVPATFASVVPSDRNRSRDAWFVLIAVNISVKRSVCYASASCWIGLLLERLTLRLELALRGEQVADTSGDAAAKSVAESHVPRQTKITAPPACTDGALSTPGVDQLNG
jgi:hypothetical protein